MFQKRKIGLALSGGGMRGMAHVGVLRVLEENKIPIDMISGTSMGALIGAMYASEPNAKKLEKEILDEKIGKLFDYTLSRYGFVKGNKIEGYLKGKLKDTTFKDLKIPLYITALDLDNKREVIFSKGDVVKAVRASISIPGVFIPIENDGRILVDAGAIDPVPTEILKKSGADLIIAVNVNVIKSKSPIYNEEAVQKKGNKSLPNAFSSTVRSLDIMGSESAKADLQGDKADFIININVEDIGIFDFTKSKIAIEAGKRAARKSLSDLKNITEPNPLKNFLDDLNRDLGVKQIVKGVKKTIKKASSK